MRGLVINRAGDDGIEIDVNAGGSTIVGNYLGTDVSGRQTSSPSVNALLAGLRELGYVEGRNLVLEPRFADGKLKCVPLRKIAGTFDGLEHISVSNQFQLGNWIL